MVGYLAAVDVALNGHDLLAVLGLSLALIHVLHDLLHLRQGFAQAFVVGVLGRRVLINRLTPRARRELAHTGAHRRLQRPRPSTFKSNGYLQSLWMGLMR